LSRVLDEGTFGILNGFIYFSQVDIVSHIQNNDALLVELLSVFKGTSALKTSDTAIQDDSPLDPKKRDTLMFLHQLFTLAKPLQAIGRIALYRGLIDRGLLYVVEWAFRRREAQILHTASEILTFTLEHDTNAVRSQILKEHDARDTTLLDEMIGIQAITDNTGLASHLSDSIRHLLDIPHEGEVRC
jgi:protein phosphatase-4 regulatory subunit 3